MSFATIVGQLLQQGMAGQTGTRDRLRHAAGGSAGGLDQMLGALLGGGTGGGGAAGQGGFGDLAGLARDYLGSPQAGGLTGAQVGGLGALAGAVLGGGRQSAKGALGGGAMAILGTLALSALKNYQAPTAAMPSGAAAGQPGQAAVVRQPAPEEIAAVTDPATEKLVLRSMIAAAKADGAIDQEEMQRIVGHLEPDGVTAAERQFVMEEMARPLDMAEIARQAASPAVAAEVYAAAILAIDIDSEAERRYLRDFAAALGLDRETVKRLHELTGAPHV